MPITRVVRDQVHDHAQTTAAGLGDQAVEYAQVAEDRVDRGVVRDVISPVGVRGGCDGTQPDRIHPEPGKVIEMIDNALEIAVSITVRIGERTDVDLVDDGRTPPGIWNRGLADRR